MAKQDKFTEIKQGGPGPVIPASTPSKPTPTPVAPIKK